MSEPFVCCVAGMPGSGKSTVGRLLAARLGAVLLDQDTATNPLMAQLARLAGAGDDLDHPALRGPVRQARYDCLIDVAVENVGIGSSVVLVAPFTAEVRDPVSWAELGRRFDPVPLRLVWVAVPAAVARDRRRRRNLPRDAAWAASTADADVPPPVVPHLLADGTADPATEAGRVAALLLAGGPDGSAGVNRRRQFARATGNQRRGHAHVHRRTGVAVQSGQQAVRRRPSDVEGILVDHRDRRRERCRQGKITERDHRYVGAVQLMQGADHADRRSGVGGEYRRWRGAPVGQQTPWSRRPPMRPRRCR